MASKPNNRPMRAPEFLKAMESLGKDRAQMADVLGVTVRQVYRYTSGETDPVPPPIANLVRRMVKDANV